MQISICIDKILTAGHNNSLEYNPLGTNMMIPEEDTQTQNSGNEQEYEPLTG